MEKITIHPYRKPASFSPFTANFGDYFSIERNNFIEIYLVTNHRTFVNIRTGQVVFKGEFDEGTEFTPLIAENFEFRKAIKREQNPSFIEKYIKQEQNL